MCGPLSAAFRILAPLVILMASQQHARAGLPRSGVDDSVVLAASPVVSADYAAVPSVTCPAETVARFSLTPLTLIATVVDARLTHEIALVRIGGIYGP